MKLSFICIRKAFDTPDEVVVFFEAVAPKTVRSITTIPIGQPVR